MTSIAETIARLRNEVSATGRFRTCTVSSANPPRPIYVTATLPWSLELAHRTPIKLMPPEEYTMDEDSDFDAGFYGEKFARFDGLGEDSVARLLGTAGIVPQDRDAALVWLGRKAKEKSREVRFRANIALAISAIALVVAIISCAVAIMVALR